MSAPLTLGQEPSSPVRDGAAFEIIAAEQVASCLARLNRLPELEAVLASVLNTPAESCVRHHIAVALARGGNTDEALEHVRRAILRDPAGQRTRQLGYRILLHAAKELARSEQWARISDLMVDALEFAPSGSDPARDFAAFGDMLAMGYVRAGQRPRAAEAWERQLRDNPDDCTVLHNLALLHFWEARSANGDAVSAWELAIAYWTLLVHHDGFWGEWRQRRASAWCFDLPPASIETIRTQFVQNEIERALGDEALRMRQAGQAERADSLDEIVAASIRERKCAELWRELVSLRRPTGALLAQPGGYLFFDRHKQLEEVRRFVARHAKLLDDVKAGWIHIYFAAGDLGKIACLIVERNRPEEAIERLQKLSGSPEVACLKAQALMAQAKLRFNQLGFAAVLELYFSAQQLVKLAPDGPHVLTGLFARTGSELRREATLAIKKEATRLKSDDQFEAAATLLERTQSLDYEGELAELWSILLCDLGFEALEAKNWRRAHMHFDRVLRGNPTFARAKQGKAATFNSEGLSKDDPAEAVRFFENAADLVPENQTYRSNVVGASMAVAVGLIGGLVQRADLAAARRATTALERALQRGYPQIPPEAIEQLKSAGLEMLLSINSDVPDEELKKLLGMLVLAHVLVRQIRSGAPRGKRLEDVLREFIIVYQVGIGGGVS